MESSSGTERRTPVFLRSARRNARRLSMASVAFLLIAACVEPVDEPPGPGIEFFEGTYVEALAKATAEEKLVFIDVYTDWCGPCKLMDLNVFIDQGVGRYFNEQFVCIKRNQEAETFDGPELTGPNEVKELPTYLFIGADGEHVHVGTGYFEPAAFVRLGEAAINGTVPSFSAMHARYEAGERDRQFVRRFLVEAGDLPLRSARSREGWLFRHEMQKVWQEYLAETAMHELVNADDFSLLARFLGKAEWDDPLIQFVANNYDAFVAVASESRVAFLLLESIKTSVGVSSGRGDSSYSRFIDELDGILAPAYRVQLDVLRNDYLFKDYLNELGSRRYARSQQDWQALHGRLEEELAAKGDAATAMDYAMAASSFLESPEEVWLKRGLEFARRAFELEPGPSTGLTYMSLLQRLQHYEEMAEVGKIALEDGAAQEMDPDYLYFIEAMLLESEFGSDRRFGVST